MPKPMFVWSGSAWVSVATEVESLANFATQSYAANQPGSKLIVPSSVAVGSGSGSVATQGTVSFSGASSVSVNDVFSATYSNYIILLNTTGSANQQVNFRLRVSGTDSTTAYGSQSSASDSTSVFGSRLTPGFWQGNDVRSADRHLIRYELFNPQAAADTFGFQKTASIVAGDTTQISQTNFTLVHDVATAYTGFSLIASTGTMTGTVSVYGYKAG